VSPRRYAGALGLLALLVPLAACGADASGSSGSSGSSASSGSGSSGSGSSGSTAASGAAWNPCGDLSARRVGAALGARVTVDTGSADQPRCAFLPAATNGPTLNVTYLWFDGRFEQAFTSMGRLEGRVTRPAVPGADATRLVVNTNRQATLVTGFVKTGRLVETVNAVQLTPSDPRAVVRATRRVMTTLVAHAPASEAAAARAAGFPG
jgi:hypothetical protein